MGESPGFQAKIQDYVSGLGPAGPTFQHAFRVLSRLYGKVRDEPSVMVRFREWRSYLSTAYGEPGGDQALFVKHTYLSTLARLIAFYHIQSGQPGASVLDKEDQIKVIAGDYFRERDIYNFAEEDLFTWFLHPKVLDESLELVGWLIKTLAAYDLPASGPELLKRLYRELAGPETRPDLGEYCTPDGLAERILRQELKLQGNLDMSLLDPACGSGTFLVTAVHLIREGMERRSEDEFDTMMHIQNGVMGVDADPIAVAVARTSYLLALGDLITRPHPPVLVPVYLADATQLPDTTPTLPSGESEESVHIVTTTEANTAFELPDSVVSDPAQLDWLFHRLSQYIHAARFRTGLEGQERATEEVINSLYSYLSSPKRAGLHELPPLSPFAAGVICQTARTLIRLALEGKGAVWLHILKNSPAPVFLNRRKFDLVVSDRSRLLKDPAAQLFARSAELYLRDGGSIAFLMPPAATEDGQKSISASASTLRVEQVLDLDQGEFAFNTPSCLVVAKKGDGTEPKQP